MIKLFIVVSFTALVVYAGISSDKCSGVTRKSLREKKKRCKKLSNKDDIKQCKQEVRYGRLCLAGGLGGKEKSFCRNIVSFFTKRKRRYIKDFIPKEYQKESLKRLKQIKKDLKSECRKNIEVYLDIL